MPSWSQAHESLVRERYGQVPTRELARSVGRSALAVKQKALKLGVAGRRYYTPEEERTVRALYPTQTARQIAVALYGDDTRLLRVVKLADKLGLKKWHFWPAEVLDRVRELHAEGLTDGQIARAMEGTFAAGDNGRLQVKNIRDRFALPPNRDSEHAREARRQGVRSQHRTLGLSNPNELRQRAYRAFAARYGLPEDLRPAQVRMVLAMLDGPKTLPELKAAIGARPESGLLHNPSGTSYQADLVHRGLVASVRTGVAGPVKGPRLRYLLAAACLDLLASVPHPKEQS